MVELGKRAGKVVGPDIIVGVQMGATAVGERVGSVVSKANTVSN